MIDLQTIKESELNRGMLLLQREFKRRGWRAWLAYQGSPICYIDRGDNKRLRIFSTTPPTTSYAAAYVANDKLATYALLDSIGVRQLASVSVSNKYGKGEAQQLLSQVGSVVVKPFDGGHGKGITVGVTTEQQLDDAITYAVTFTKSAQRVIVQAQYRHETSYDIRIACIDGKYQAAIWRVPARVWGDGTHTVRELVEIENASPRRGEPYYAPLARIDVDRAAQFLGNIYETTPEDGQEVTVLGVANYGAGGELVDVTDDLPKWMIKEAETVSMTAELYVSGVDYMTAKVPTPEMTRDELDAVIIEINKCPSLAIHDLPTQGEPRGAVAAYVDYLATIVIT